MFNSRRITHLLDRHGDLLSVREQRRVTGVQAVIAGFDLPKALVQVEAIPDVIDIRTAEQQPQQTRLPLVLLQEVA